MKGILNRARLENTPIEIIYMSQNGILTQRFIKVIEINDQSIKAYCLLRGNKRTFKIDNILSAASKKKGEIKRAN
ncbi:hypothetical protein [Fredinandcohnia sp. 179-A 10B2 NHS]|uniref:hypothetical protein n=1 Tax=Fredinandcohnia sp. 179-A 10B2 NHS TaxID=3235176 RepID=UPI0039A02B10